MTDRPDGAREAASDTPEGAATGDPLNEDAGIEGPTEPTQPTTRPTPSGTAAKPAAPPTKGRTAAGAAGAAGAGGGRWCGRSHSGLERDGPARRSTGARSCTGADPVRGRHARHRHAIADL